MSDTIDDIAERRSALDAFASASPVLPTTIQPGSSMAQNDRVFGAQKVAVFRNEQLVLQKLKALASAAGDDWYYRFPVKNNKTGRTTNVEGPSIKLANDLARLYGNCEIDTRVQDLGDAWLIYARFTDFETGFTMTRPFQQRKSQTSMKADDDRARDIAFQIGVSKAMRNVTVNALQTFSDFAFEEAKHSLVEKIGSNLPGWRDRVAVRLEEQDIDVKRVEAVIGRPLFEFLAPDVAKVVAMIKAIIDGMASKDETFPPIGDKTKSSHKGSSGLESFAAGEKETDDPQKSGHSSTQAEADKVITESGAVIKDKDSEAAVDVAKDGAGPSNAEAEKPGDGPAAEADAEVEDDRPEEVQTAEALGRQARQKGRPKTMLPKEYEMEGREAERDAWLHGHANGGK